MADEPYTVSFALRVTGRALAGLSFRGADHLSGPVADWFPLSVFLLGWGSLGLVLAEWLAPWRYRLRRGAHELALVRRLVATWGADTLAPFALRADKSYFFSEDESAFLAYRVVGGVAIVSGDPIGRGGRARASSCAASSSSRTSAAGASPCSASRSVPRPVPRARSALALSRRRGGRRHGGVLARRPADPQGAAIGPPVARGRVRGADPAPERDRRDDAGGARDDRPRLARRRSGARLRDGARHALPARQRRCGLRDRPRPRRPPEGVPPLRRLATRAPRCRSRRCRASATCRTDSRNGSSAKRSSGRASTASRTHRSTSRRSRRCSSPARS